MPQNLLGSDGIKGFVAVLPSTSPIVAEQIRRKFKFLFARKILGIEQGTMVAHNCHGKTKNLTAKTKTSRQNQKPHGKIKYFRATTK